MSNASGQHPSEQTPGSLWLHRWAVLAAVAVFPLVLSGGTVTSLKVGMADPLWPTPPWYLLMISWAEYSLGFLIEHGHRQLGWIVGLMTVVLAFGLWRTEDRRWVRWLGATALLAVTIQGILGGLRVKLNELFGIEFAMAHGFLAQVVFSLMAGIALVTSPSWRRGSVAEFDGASRIQRLAVIITDLFLAQLLVGVFLRQGGMGLIIHLILAFALMAHVFMLAGRVLGSSESWATMLKTPVLLLMVLTAGQIALGLGAWSLGAGKGAADYEAVTRGRAILATGHVGVGALLLATSFLLTLRSYRHLRPSPKAISISIAATEGAA